MEEDSAAKPILSFGISSILGASNYHSHLKTSNTERLPRSAFRLTKGRNSDTTESRQKIETSKETTQKDPIRGPDLLDKKLSAVTSHKDANHGLGSIIFNNIKPVTSTATCSNIDFANLLAARVSQNSTNLLLNHRSQQITAAGTTGLSTGAPFLPLVTPTENYLLKSFDTFRPKNYGEYRRIGHPYSNRTPPKRKKPRTTFNRDQVAELEARFIGQKYLASTERLRLANHLQLTDSQVKTWFQNRRTKWRRQTAEEREAERNAATKYIMKIQQHSAAVVQAAGASLWPSLIPCASTSSQQSDKSTSS